MEFPEYHIYAESVAQRNMLILFALAAVALCLELIYLAGLGRPWMRQAVMWLSIGGFYATLALVAVSFFAGS